MLKQFLCYRMDKQAFSKNYHLKHSIVIGADGSLYALLNTVNSIDESFIVE